MASTKHVLILANSIKHWPGVCIAGREILSNGSHYSPGQWIRPVSTVGEGELSLTETKLSNGKQPTILDCVEIQLTHNVKDPLQPENWLNDHSQQWRSVNSLYQKPPWSYLQEAPASLWAEKGERSDRVSPGHLKNTPPVQSIYLVYVTSIRVRFEWNGTEDSSSGVERCLRIVVPITN